MSEQFERVSVINRNDFAISDRCDGVGYEFPAGLRTVIPADVARHLFLFPAEERVMHEHMARRWGWNRPEHYKSEYKGKPIDVPLWQFLCRNIQVLMEKYELRRIRDPDAPIPAEHAREAPDTGAIADDKPPPRRASKKTLRGWSKRKLTPRVARPERIDLLARDPVRPQPPPAAELVLERPEPQNE